MADQGLYVRPKPPGSTLSDEEHTRSELNRIKACEIKIRRTSSDCAGLQPRSLFASAPTPKLSLFGPQPQCVHLSEIYWTINLFLVQLLHQTIVSILFWRTYTMMYLPLLIYPHLAMGWILQQMGTSPILIRPSMLLLHHRQIHVIFILVIWMSVQNSAMSTFLESLVSAGVVNEIFMIPHCSIYTNLFSLCC